MHKTNQNTTHIFLTKFLITFALRRWSNIFRTASNLAFCGHWRYWGEIANFGEPHIMTARGKIIFKIINALTFLIHISLRSLWYIPLPPHTKQNLVHMKCPHIETSFQKCRIFSDISRNFWLLFNPQLKIVFPWNFEKLWFSRKFQLFSHISYYFN